MKTFFAITVVGIASAHKPVPAAHFAALATPLNVETVGAMGESYHNAFKYCAEKTTTWFDEIGVSTKDITFENSYGKEFDIFARVPRTYAAI